MREGMRREQSEPEGRRSLLFPDSAKPCFLLMSLNGLTGFAVAT